MDGRGESRLRAALGATMALASAAVVGAGAWDPLAERLATPASYDSPRPAFVVRGAAPARGHAFAEARGASPAPLADGPYAFSNSLMPPPPPSGAPRDWNGAAAPAAATAGGGRGDAARELRGFDGMSVMSNSAPEPAPGGAADAAAGERESRPEAPVSWNNPLRWYDPKR